MRSISSLLVTFVVILILSSCRALTSSQGNDLSNDYVDTTIVLLNVDTLNKAEVADVINFLSDKDVQLIALNLNFKEDDKGDSVLISQIKATRSKIVASCDLELNRGGNNPYYEYLEFGPAALYKDKQDRVTSFSFLYQAKDGTWVESFYLKILKYTRPDLYNKCHADSDVYKINFLGNRNSFPNVYHSELDYTVDSFWRGKIVLLGHLGTGEATMSLVKPLTNDNVDAFFTPTLRGNVPEGKPNMYGVVITANIISGLLMQQKSKRYSR